MAVGQKVLRIGTEFLLDLGAREGLPLKQLEEFAMDRLKRPDGVDRPVALRGLSWIVNPYEDGGVVIAIEITLGAAIAGPFDIDQTALEGMIERVLTRPASTVH